MAPDDPRAVETAYLAVLTRRPTPEEAAHFEAARWPTTGRTRAQRLEDLFWALDQLDGVLMEPLTRTPRSTAAASCGRAGLAGAELADAGRATCWPAPPRRSRQAREPAQSIILLWLQGGPSQLETFDPHPGTRHRRRHRGHRHRRQGRAARRRASDALAEEMGSIALVRSMVSKEGDHERGTYTMKTGFRPDPTVVHPSIGAICCHELPAAGDRHPAARQHPARPVARPRRLPRRRVRRLPTGDPAEPVPDTTLAVCRRARRAAAARPRRGRSAPSPAAAATRVEATLHRDDGGRRPQDDEFGAAQGVRRVAASRWRCGEPTATRRSAAAAWRPGG